MLTDVLDDANREIARLTAALASETEARQRVEALLAAVQSQFDRMSELAKAETLRRQEAERERETVLQSRDYWKRNAEDAGQRLSQVIIQHSAALDASDLAREGLRTALANFAPGSHDGLWGRIKAFIVNGAPTREEGIQIARQITEWQVAIPESAYAAVPALRDAPSSETQRI